MYSSEDVRMVKHYIQNAPPGWLYDPIIMNEEVLFENKRLIKEQWHRLQVIENGPSLDGERVIDIGCNTGYMGAMLMDRYKLRQYTGIDRYEICIKIAEILYPHEKMQWRYQYAEESAVIDLMWADYVFLLSVSGLQESKKYLLYRAFDMCEKGLYFEPTNHTHLENSEYIAAAKAYIIDTLDLCESGGEIQDLGVTDYQNRHIFFIEKG
jgi:hypothetical protein